MEIKITYKNENLNIEGVATTEEEVAMIKKSIIYFIKDIDEVEIKMKKVSTPNTANTELKNPEETQQIENASVGQVKYMQKLGIQIPIGCTKAMAIQLIDEYKKTHNIPISHPTTRSAD